MPSGSKYSNRDVMNALWGLISCHYSVLYNNDDDPRSLTEKPCEYTVMTWTIGRTATVSWTGEEVRGSRWMGLVRATRYRVHRKGWWSGGWPYLLTWKPKGSFGSRRSLSTVLSWRALGAWKAHKGRLALLSSPTLQAQRTARYIRQWTPP